MRSVLNLQGFKWNFSIDLLVTWLLLIVFSLEYKMDIEAFYPHSATVIGYMLWPPVLVCLSQAGIASKLLNRLSCLLL